MHVMWKNRIRGDDRDQVGIAGETQRKLRILIVDDDPDTAVSLSFLCRLWGYETEFCFGGIAALQAAVAFEPDVFLLDVAMPRIDGYTLALKLRGLPSCANAIFIAISGWADASHRAKGFDCGFDHYLVKPAEPSVLKALLASARYMPLDRATPAACAH